MQAGLQHYGETGNSGWGAAGSGLFAAETGTAESAHKLLTGQGSWEDVVGLAMWLTPVHENLKGEEAPKVEEPVKGEEPANGKNEESPKNEEEAPKVEAAPEEKASTSGDGEAYADGGDAKIEAEPVADAASAAQKGAIANVEDGTTLLEGYDGHHKGNHIRKGNYGEMKMDQHFEGIKEINGEKAELTPLHERVTNIDETGHTGIDGVYENAHPPPKYVIAESKYGSSELSPNTKDGPQMSDDWVEGSKRLENAVGKQKAREIIAEGYDKVLTKVDANGNVTTYKIDSKGNITGLWP